MPMRMLAGLKVRVIVGFAFGQMRIGLIEGSWGVVEPALGNEENSPRTSLAGGARQHTRSGPAPSRFVYLSMLEQLIKREPDVFGDLTEQNWGDVSTLMKRNRVQRPVASRNCLCEPR